MAKDINIHLKTRGTQQTKRELDHVGDSTKKVGHAVEKGGKSAETAGFSFGRFAKKIVAWGAGFFGIAATIRGITKALEINAQAMEEHANIAEKHQKKLLALQAMGDFYKERPQLRKEVAAKAEFGRRPFEEVAEAWYTLRSQAGRMTPKQREGILNESLELGRMYPEAPLTDLINMFTLYAKATRSQDLNQAQNVLLQTITEAGGSMGAVSKFMPQFLGPAMAGGLTGPEAAGLWAHATTLPEAGGIEKASTALRNVLLILQGKGETPEATKMLQGFGITPEMGFFEQMEILAAEQQAGKFGLPQALLLAGREGAPMLTGLLKDPKMMRETIEKVVQAGASQRDIAAETLKGLMGTDEIARLEEEGRQLTIAIDNLKAQDTESLRWRVHLKHLEKDMRLKGLSEVQIHMRLWGERQKRNLGWEQGEFEREKNPPFPLSTDYRWNDNAGLGMVNPASTAGPNIINVGTIFNPVVGVNKEDLGMGPSASRNLQ